MSTLWTESIARIRQLRHEAGHTLAVVLSLAIGMAMCVAVYSVVDGLVFATVPGIEDRQTLVRLTWSQDRGLFTPAEFQLLAGHDRGAFADLAAQGDRTLPVMTPSGPIAASAAFVSPRFFETLGTLPVRGRLLTGADAEAGVPAIVVSESFWRGTLDGRPDAIGSSLSVGGRAYTIVGVAPARAPGLRVIDAGTPDAAYPQLWLGLADAIRWSGGDRPGEPWLSVAGRLRPGASVNAARAEVAAVQPRLAAQSFLRRDAFLQALPAGLDWRAQPIEALLAFGLFMFLPLAVLAIGCVNVVNLQLARAVEQAGELSLRLALGASRGRLLWILSVDVALLSVGAGVLGWLAGAAIVAGAARFVSGPLTVDADPTLLVAAMVTAVAALTGLLPAWLSTRDTVANGLRLLQQGGSRVQARARRLLVALQLAGSLPLLALGSLAAQALIRQAPALPPDADRVLVSDLALADVRSTPPRPGPFVDAILDSLSAEPSIETAAFATFAVVGQPVPYRRGADAGEARYAYGGHVTAAWFEATGARFLAGRPPERRTAGRPAELVVNAALAAALAREGAQALGGELRLASTETPTLLEVATIVGVVADTMKSPDGQPVPMIVRPMPQDAFSHLVLIAKARDVGAGRGAIQRAVTLADAAVPVGRIESFRGRVDEQRRDLRGIVAIGFVFGALALALAALGLYALQGYTVRRRTREIGIRIAIGAGRRDILWLIGRQAVGLASLGSIVGLAVAIPMGAVMRSVLAGTSPLEPWALLPTIGVLVVVAVAASAGPAWRAASIDPVRALRQD